jgi:PKD repeat protein
MDPMGAEANGNKHLPDLHVEALYNYTKVYEGNSTWFNLTIHNAGDAAFLVRTSGNLEIYAYRDDETQVAAFERVYEDMFVNQTLVVDFQVQFNSVGAHTLTVVIDEANRIKELNESNNQATANVQVFPSTTNRPPSADGGNDRTGHMGQSMLFSAAYSSDPDNDVLTYKWDFGDGSLGSGVRTHHSYDEVGDYRVELIVSDGEFSAEDVFTVHVVDLPKNQAPVAVITVSTYKVLVDRDLTLDGTSSYDPDDDDLEYEWDFDASDGVDDWVRGPVVAYSWPIADFYTVTLRVDDDTVTDTTQVEIEVGTPPPPNKPPTANAGADVIMTSGDTWTLTGTGYDTDGTVVSYEWDLDGDGVYDTYSETEGKITHTFQNVGYLTVKLRVTDDRGATHVDSMVVTANKAQADDDKAAPGPPAFTVIIVILAAALLVRRSGIWGYWQRFQR